MLSPEGQRVSLKYAMKYKYHPIPWSCSSSFLGNQDALMTDYTSAVQPHMPLATAGLNARPRHIRAKGDLQVGLLERAAVSTLNGIRYKPLVECRGRRAGPF